MKFYYNGKLIRTSKTHIYTHAVISANGYVVGCRTSKEAAEAVKTAEINRYMVQVGNEERAMEAIANGKRFYTARDGRGRGYQEQVSPSGMEYYEKVLASDKRAIEYMKNCWMVVELEVR